MSDFKLKYPRSARAFDCTVSGYEAWEVDCMDHGWRPASPEVYAYSDALMVRAASWYNSTDFFATGMSFYRLSKLRQEFARMARRTTQSKQETRATWQGFLDFRLNETQLMELDEWEPTPAEIWQSVDKLLTSGYRLTLSYSAKLKAATCSIMDDSRERKSGGWSLASSDVDGSRALKAAVYKHFLVLEGSWDTLLDTPAQPGMRG